MKYNLYYNIDNIYMNEFVCEYLYISRNIYICKYSYN